MGYRQRIYFTEKQQAEIWDLAARGVDEFDRADVRSQLLVDLSFVGQDRRDPTAGAAKISFGADACRTRGDLPRA